MLTLRCPFCGHEHADDFECLDSGRADTIRCENPSCNKRFAYLVRECLGCGGESVFTWGEMPTPEALVKGRENIYFAYFWDDLAADKLGEYLKRHALVRQKPHPFPLHKKWEAAGKETEENLFRALATLADLEVKRKSGGVPVDLGLEMFLLSRVKQ